MNLREKWDELRGLRHFLAYLTLIGASVGWIVIIVWSVWPYSNISASPFVTNGEQFKAGDVVEMTDMFCWDGTPFRTEPLLVSVVSERELGAVRFPNGYAIPALEEKYGQGCAQSNVKIQIPVTTPPGEYSIRYDVTYRPNPIRVVSFSNESNKFTVK